MNKKKQNKKTSNPRRGNGRVYTLPETNKAIIDALSNLPFPANPIFAESICDKARRLANEAEESKKKERAERELAFMKKMFETEDLAGAGVVMDKVREDGTIEYLICGRRWIYRNPNTLFPSGLVNLDTYLGFNLHPFPFIPTNNLKSFGQLIKEIDNREAELRAKYPDNWWGRLKAWWHQFSIF